MQIKFTTLLAALSFLITTIAVAQVGIGNISPNATLDVSATNQATPSNNDGILIPRIDAFPSANPGTNQDSMLVYLTTTSGGQTPGFYYWNNGAGAWQELSGDDTQDLSIDNTVGDLSLVNGGIVEIKTIADSDDDTLIQVEQGGDDDTIRFDVGGTEYFTMNSNGQLEVFNTGNSVCIGENAGASDTGSNNNIVAIGTDAASATTNEVNITAVGYQAASKLTGFTASGNSAFGSGAMFNATSGENNTVIGYTAMYFNTAAGNFNTAIGYRSMGSSSFTGGDKNTGVGGYTLEFADGDYNTAIGYGASREQEAGDYNTSVGYHAGLDTQSGNNNVYLGYHAGGGDVSGSGRGFTRSNNIFIGVDSGTGDSNSNRLYIENSPSNTPLIGGDFTSNRLGVNTAIGSLTHTLTVTGNAFASGGYQTPTNTYPDYVFEDYFFGKSNINEEYSFTPLNEAIVFVKENGHLPNVKSYNEIEADGMIIDLAVTSVKNLEKIEENFLYIAELKQENEILSEKNTVLEAKLSNLEKRLEHLEVTLTKQN